MGRLTIGSTHAATLEYATLDFEEIVGNGLSLVDNQTNLSLCLLGEPLPFEMW
jgi:hypothetical protein